MIKKFYRAENGWKTLDTRIIGLDFFIKLFFL